MAKKGKLDMQFVVDTKKPTKNITELTKKIQDMRSELEGTDFGTDRFNELSGAIANSSSEMKVLEKNMEGLEPQQKAEAFLKMGEGIVGAFAVAQGALGLMGIENENLEKIQVRVQSAIAIATGIRMMSEAALMAATAKRVAVEKAGLIATKMGVVWAKAMAVGNALWAVGQGALSMSIGATTVALHALKAAIMATGIGALALLIVGLVVAVFSYVSATDSSTAAEEKHAAATRATSEALLEKSNAMIELGKSYKSQKEHEFALIDAETESEKALLKKQKRLGEMEDRMEGLIATQTRNAELLAEHGDDALWLAKNKSTIEHVNTAIAKQVEYNETMMDGIRVLEQAVESEAKAEADRAAARARGKARRAQREKDADSLRKLEDELLLLEEQDMEKRAEMKREQTLANELAAAGEIRNKTIRLETLAEIQAIYDQEELNRLKKIEDDKQKVIDDAAAEKEKKAKEDAKALSDEQIKATDEYLNEIRRSNMEDRDMQIEDAKAHFEEMMLAKGLTKQEEAMLRKELNEQIDEINRVHDEEEKAIEDEKLQASLDTLASSLDAISANMDARVSELDNAMNRELEMEGLTEQQKEDIQTKFQKKKDAIAKRQKAIAASQAVIDTYVSAVAAYKSMVGIPTVGPVLAPIAAGAAIAMGLANVRQIYAQDVGGGGGGGGGGAGGITGEEVSAPKSGSFTLSGGAPEQQPIKAYVVTDDMTDSQSQLEDIRQESTI